MLIHIGFWVFLFGCIYAAEKFLRVFESNIMVDLHCHILPGVDDGARSIEESLNMLRKQADGGVELVVATPHLLRGSYDTDIAECQELTSELQQAADRSGIGIQIKFGVEYYLAPQILDDIDRLADFTIDNNGRYILVEFPMHTIPTSTEDIFFNMKTKGITPVLAHPERNARICHNPSILLDLVTKGCLTQINVGSLLGHFGRAIRKAARDIITHNLAHVVASDMHSVDSPSLDQGVPEVEKLLGKKKAARLFVENPHKIIDAETIHHEELPKQFSNNRRGIRGFFSRSRMQH